MSQQDEGVGGGSAAAASEPAEAGSNVRVHHPRSFKLRFAAEREPGRSYVSAVKPLGLPATVTGKFYSRGAAAPADELAGAAATERHIRDMFERGPRDKYRAPRTTAHQYGWWSAAAPPLPRGDRRLHHHIRDSAWLKARLAVLAADQKLRHQ